MPGLIEAAFGRHDESVLVTALRGEGLIAYEWVATMGDDMVGHLVLSRLISPENCLALAPVSVHPDHQKKGIGAAMIHAALELAEDEDWAAVFVLGDPRYYKKFGFSVSEADEFSTPYASAFTAVVDLDPRVFASLSREIVYPRAFSGL